MLRRSKSGHFVDPLQRLTGSFYVTKNTQTAPINVTVGFDFLGGSFEISQ